MKNRWTQQQKNIYQRKGQVYFVDIWYSKQYGLNMEEKGRFYFLTKPMW